MDEINERIQNAYVNSILKEKKSLSVPEKHQLAIAKKTMKMSDAGANIMGGMSKKEAVEFLKKIGYSDARIKKISEDTELNESSQVEFEDFDKGKQKFITSLVGKGKEKNQAYFDGIHGTVVSLHSMVGDNMRLTTKDIQKLAKNKDVRWIDVSNIGMGYNTDKE